MSDAWMIGSGFTMGVVLYLVVQAGINVKWWQAIVGLLFVVVCWPLTLGIIVASVLHAASTKDDEQDDDKPEMEAKKVEVVP